MDEDSSRVRDAHLSGEDQAPIDELGTLRAKLVEARRALAATQAKLDEKLEREALLHGELQHRVRNMLAVVRSIFSRTVAAGGSLEDVADHFRGRTDVLARYQLTRTDRPDASADFEMMVLDELQSAHAGSDPRVTVKGPPVRIRHDAAQLVALAIHELITNSIKFGVLSSPREPGRLSVAWRVSEGVLHVTWRETGPLVAVEAPVHYGFGSDFIKEALPYQLGATTTFALSCGKLACTMSIPLGHRV